MQIPGTIMMSAAALKREIEMLLGLHGEQAARLWQAAATTSSPRPTPTSHPNISVGTPVTVQGAGNHFDGDYLVTSVQHTVPTGSYRDDLVRCVVAAVTGNQASLVIHPVWAKLKMKLAPQPAQVRNAIGHELVHTLQQGGGRR